jgi:hypothetical protein
MSQRRVTISYRAAIIIASLLPSKYLTLEAHQAVIEFFAEVVKVKKQVEGEEKDPDS